MLRKLAATAKEIWATIPLVHREVAPVDRLYVAYSWLSQVIAYVRSLGLIVLGSFTLGQYVDRQLTFSFVLMGLIAYALYVAGNTLLMTWAYEHRRIFYRQLTTRMELRRLQHMATLDLGRLVDPAFQELLQMVETRGSVAIRQLWDAQIVLVSSFIGVIAGVAILLGLDWILGVLALSIALPHIVERWLGEQRSREIEEREIQTRRERNEVFEALTRPSSAVLMRMLSHTEGLVRRYSQYTSVIIENMWTLLRYERTLSYYTSAATLLSIVVLGGYAAMQLPQMRYSVTEIGAILGSFQIVLYGIQGFGWSLADIDQRRRDLEYLHRFFETKPLIDEDGFVPTTLRSTPELRLQGVSFTYPGQHKAALRDVTVTIQPGEKIALVGPNGCGKTTLLRLIARTYVPQSGSISSNDDRLDRVVQRSWLRHHLMVTQGATLPGFEVMHAITGAEPFAVDDARLQSALWLSAADTIIDKLPHGLQTWIGEEWKDGHGFSTGERQRLLLASAFYRMNDPEIRIVSFDEPTANCDAETKERFYDAIQDQRFSEKTILVALHDPLYLDRFERVLQFEDGCLAHDLRGTDEILKFREQIVHRLSRDL